MNLINKHIQVQHDPVDDTFVVSVVTDKDGTVWVKDAKTIKDVLYLIGKVTKSKINYVG